MFDIFAVFANSFKLASNANYDPNIFITKKQSIWISNYAVYATFKFVGMSIKKFELNNYEL